MLSVHVRFMKRPARHPVSSANSRARRASSSIASSHEDGPAWRRDLQRARSLLASGGRAEAVVALESIVARVPHELEPRHVLADCHFRSGRLADALREYHELSTYFPDRSDVANDLACVLSTIGHQELALRVAERALQLDPENVVAMHNLAEIFRHMGNWSAARDVYAAALTLAPAHAKARMQYGMTLIGLGDWKGGWSHLEAREEAIGRHILFEDDPNTPRWNGVDPIAGKTLLVQHEQGLGDSLMVVRFAKELARRGAVVHWRCPAPLVPLFSIVAGISGCSAPGTPFPDHDMHIPLMSLMGVLDVTPDALDGAPYLMPPGQCAPHIAALLPRDRVPTIALTWAGNPLHINDHRRSIRGELLAPLLELDGVRFAAMQKAPPMVDVLPEELRSRIIDLGAHCTNFMDSAHALMRVDLVVTVDTAVAHLAGALGIPTLLCLPFSGDFRWGVTGTSTPWYRSMTLLRQEAAMQWSGVIEDVRTHIRALQSSMPSNVTGPF